LWDVYVTERLAKKTEGKRIKECGLTRTILATDQSHLCFGEVQLREIVAV
jgi:hypothetical protein